MPVCRRRPYRGLKRGSGSCPYSHVFVSSRASFGSVRFRLAPFRSARAHSSPLSPPSSHRAARAARHSRHQPSPTSPHHHVVITSSRVDLSPTCPEPSTDGGRRRITWAMRHPVPSWPVDRTDTTPLRRAASVHGHPRKRLEFHVKSVGEAGGYTTRPDEATKTASIYASLRPHSQFLHDRRRGVGNAGRPSQPAQRAPR